MSPPEGAGLLTPRSARVVSARRLTTPAGRRAAGAFLVEGPQSVSEALAAGEVLEIFATPAAAAKHAELLYGAPPAGLIGAAAAAALSETVTPQGLLAVCTRRDVDVDTALSGRRLAVLLAEINDPGNAGTVLRTADAVGAGAVLFGRGSVDAYNGKCLRASAGSVFHLDIALDVDPLLAIATARTAGLRVVAAAGDGAADLDDEADAGRLGVRTLWVFGHEARGLPADLAAACDARVRVPIYGRAESLNLAAAAAVCLYACARAQRLPH